MMYKFIKNFERNGVKISKGVVIDRNLIVNEDCVSVIGSSVLKDIPLECLENFEPIKYIKPKKQSGPQSKKSDVRKSSDPKTSARISSEKI